MTETTIGQRYLLHEALGEGGMGTVYRATDRLTGQTVALKRVRLQTQNPSQADNLRLSIANEFRALASLRHPHIISVIDYGFDAARQPYFTMSLIPLPRTITEAAADADTAGKVRLLVEMLQALAYLHRRGIIHGDLKPANVLVNADGHVQVVDFGLAQDSVIKREEREHDDLMTGTLAYIAPELITGARVSIASDLYAVGMIAYEMFVGQHPFDTGNLGVLIDHILNRRPDVLTLDFDLSLVLERLLEKDPLQRYANAVEAMAALTRATDQPLPVESAEIRESFLQASRFVGREAETAQFEAALDRAIAGKGSSWLVGGESGVGKSRLLDEVRIQALVKGALVLRGQAAEGAGLPYQLWRDVARRLALSTPLNDLERSILKEIVPDIGALLNTHVPDPAPLANNAHQQRLMLTLAELFRRQTQPLVLILEDLQWTEEGLAALKQVNLLVPHHPLLIIGSYRDDERPDLPDLMPEMQRLHLARLSPQAIAELSSAMLGAAGQKPQVVEALQRETEGNVFFVVEVVRALAEEAGSLDTVEWAAVPSQITAGGIQQVVRRRLNRVSEDARKRLTVAAVIGRQIDLRIMGRNSIAGLNRWLTECANAAVLENVDGQWRFAHDKLRQTLIDDLPPIQLKVMHRRVAAAIENAYPGDMTYAEMLADHLYQGEDFERAALFTVYAVDNMVRITANYAQAERLLRRVMDVESPHRAHLRKLLGDVYERRGMYSDAEGEYKAALAESSADTTLRVSMMNGLSRVLRFQGNYKEAFEYAEQGLTLARAISDRAGIALCLNNMGMIALEQRDLEVARAQFNESLQIRREVGDLRAIGDSLNNLGLVALDEQNYPLAKQYMEETVAIRRQMGDRWGIGVGLGNLSIIVSQLGDYNAAAQYVQESLAIAYAIDDQWGISSNLIILGNLAYFQADYAGAQNYLEQSIVINRRTNNRHSLALGLMTLGLTLWVAGRYQEAAERYQEVIALWREMDNAPGLIESLASFALVQLSLGNEAEAHETMAEAVRLEPENNGTPAILRCLLSGAFIAKQRRQYTQAAQYAGKVVAHSGGMDDWRPIAIRLLSELATVMDADSLAQAVEAGKAQSEAELIQNMHVEVIQPD